MSMDILEYLLRKDKWYLGGGNRILWAPPFPNWLNYPGFWDKAHFYQCLCGPVFTICILDDNGIEMRPEFISRKWTPAILAQKYKLKEDIFLHEKKSCLPGDILFAGYTIENRTSREFNVHIFLYTAVETDPEAGKQYVDSIDVNDGVITFRWNTHCVNFYQALGLSEKVQSYSVNLAEWCAPHPRWEFTPFYESFRDGRLPDDISIHGLTDSGVMYFAVHAKKNIGSNSRVEFGAGAAFDLEREKVAGSLKSVLSKTKVIYISSENWNYFFKNVPYFECSDPYIQKYYWYRWYGLRLLSLKGGEGVYSSPAVCEGIGYFRAPISYSAQCHIPETRWMHDPSIARGSLLNFLHNQKEDGNFYGYLAINQGVEQTFYHSNWGWAVRELHSVYPDVEFLKRIYSGLVKYAEYFDRERDKEKSGLYDVINHYETGQEFMSRYMVVSDTADTINWESNFRLKGIDATVYIYEVKKMLAFIAEQTGDLQSADRWKNEAEFIKQAILEKMWDGQIEMFFDVNPKTMKPTGVKAAVCFYPYMTDIVDESHISGLIKHLFNPEEFWTPYPFPSTSVDDDYFNAEGRWKGKRHSCPWNGRVWPMTNSHIAEAIAQTAVRFQNQELKVKFVEFFNKFIRMMFFNGDVNRPNCFEHYNPFSGKPSIYRGVDDYQHSWVVDLIIKYVCGIRVEDFEKLIVEPFPFDMHSFCIKDVHIQGGVYSVERKGAEFFVRKNGKEIYSGKIGSRFITAL